MTIPTFTMSELLEAGVHFGHRTHRWNPKMASYIFGERNGIHVIDLTQTLPMLFQAVGFVRNTVAGNGRVLFVGTKRQVQEPVKLAAERCGMYYVNHRWLGGTLTNWKTISKSIKILKTLEEQFAQDLEINRKLAELKLQENPDQNVIAALRSPLAHFTKKERLMKMREFDKLKQVLDGVKNMGGLPDVVVVLDVKTDRIAVEEARTLGIPVVGIVDTNCDPSGVQYMIPGNDDSTRALNLYARLFSDAVLDGIASQAARSQPESAIGTAPVSGTLHAKPKGETVVKLSKAAANAVADADAAQIADATAAPKAAGATA